MDFDAPTLGGAVKAVFLSHLQCLVAACPIVKK